jgi:hypothetical protein
MLRTENCWLVTNVSEQHIRPFFKARAIQGFDPEFLPQIWKQTANLS